MNEKTVKRAAILAVGLLLAVAAYADGLPYDSRVEYLEAPVNNGVSYIDTGLYPGDDVGVLLRVRPLRESTDTTVCGVQCAYGSGVFKWYMGFIYNDRGYLSWDTVNPDNNVNVRFSYSSSKIYDIYFNYRNDRAKELTVVLTQKDMPEEGMTTIPNLQYYCMTPYDATFTGVHVLFPKENVDNTLGEYLSQKGLKQLHTAETEKYAHVTFFFNGGREAPYENEDRILVPSPKVATYDLKPEMSAYEVKDKLVAAINTQQYDFIVVNYANGDMVGHTGVYPAIEKAVVAIDNCVKDTVEAAKANDYEVIIIADHGNADHALNEDGTPNTAHSLNPVPFVYVTTNRAAKVVNGVLADVAPSILHIMGMPQPAEMTGSDLIK